MRGVFFSLCLWLLLGGFFQGCSTTEEERTNPEVVYKDAEADIENDRYLLALEKLKIVKNRFPYSKFSALAQLRMADVYYLQESFYEAAGAYEMFRELHPKHARIPYASFRIAESYHAGIPSKIERDISSAKKALDAYRDFLTSFPTDERVSDARTKMIEVKQLLAEKEMYIGDFYYDRDYLDSAEGRYQKILKLYDDTPTAKEAQARLEEIHRVTRSKPQ